MREYYHTHLYSALTMLLCITATNNSMSVAKTHPLPAQKPAHALNQWSQKNLNAATYIQMIIISYELFIASQLIHSILKKVYPYDAYAQRRDAQLLKELQRLPLQHQVVTKIMNLCGLKRAPQWRFSYLTPLIQNFIETEPNLRRQALLDKINYRYYQALIPAIGQALPHLAIASIPTLMGIKHALQKYDQPTDTTHTSTSPSYGTDPNDPEYPDDNDNKIPLIAKLHFLVMALGIANSLITQ